MQPSKIAIYMDIQLVNVDPARKKKTWVAFKDRNLWQWGKEG